MSSSSNKKQKLATDNQQKVLERLRKLEGRRQKEKSGLNKASETSDPFDFTDDDQDYVYSNNEEDPSEDEEVEKVEEQKPKKRWSVEENSLFKRIFFQFLEKKTMPPGSTLIAAQKHLTSRSVAQIRTRVHNVINGKQKLS